MTSHIIVQLLPVTMSQTRAATIELQDLDIYAPESCVLHDNKTLAPQLPGEHQHEQHEQHDSSETQASGEESSLPLVDRGKDAWLFLAACWAVEAITFGELSLTDLCLDFPGILFSQVCSNL